LSCKAPPELSVIVPVYNEEANIAPFLAEMARQREIEIEVIISDGGSTDRSIAALTSLVDQLPYPVAVVQGGKGRGRQMNLGADVARSAILLFLHIDSNFPDALALRKGVDAFHAAAPASGGEVAGHFSLQFHFDATPPLPYRYYAAKASLDRPGCTHGDQGLLIGAGFFQRIGSFDAALPLMEDTLLAERIRETGSWILLPACLRTSPRRFLTEGLLPRQTLNAILMNLAAIGRLELIECLRESYRSQDAARRLRLAPFLSVLRREIAELPARERRHLWYDTGSYVRSNAWQIPFLLDVFSGKVAEGRGGVFLGVHDRVVGRLIDNRASNWVTALLVWGWFRVTLQISQREQIKAER
jgi:rSAM/selenodomain-associated transferase 2